MSLEKCPNCGALERVYDGAGRRHECPGKAADPPSPVGCEMSADEARVDALILEVMQGILSLNGRRLRANHAEMAQAIHVLQGFPRQAACNRLGLFNASDWWEDA